ncbi:LOW QUALITY PROTEIN: Myoglobin [Frankliniella fusca]|uniref:Myoglobin n=1 Tax=Frankliniella fusca TaxID=407009 RepID=A0AAE1HL36_9NEOP|nr:LOW QUALITY PROTEIN: Myoglobin [Frankliniella fusca]
MCVSGWEKEAKRKRCALLYLRLQAEKRRLTVETYKKKVQKVQHHDTLGAWATTIPIAKDHDPEVFYDMFRVWPEAFDRLLALDVIFKRSLGGNRSALVGENYDSEIFSGIFHTKPPRSSAKFYNYKDFLA